MFFVISVILDLIGLGLMHSLIDTPFEPKTLLISMIILTIFNVAGAICCKDKL